MADHIIDVERGVATCEECSTDATKRVDTIVWKKDGDSVSGTRKSKYYCKRHFEEKKFEVKDD